MAELLRTDRWEGELVRRKRDGTPVIQTCRWSLKRDEQGRPAAILETSNDITSRRQAQEALREAQEDLARVNRVMLLSELTSSIAHEVKQPLSAIATSASAATRWLATAPPHFDEATTALERIVRDCQRAAEIIGRVSALVKKEAPRKDLLDINAAILEVIAMSEDVLQSNHVILRTGLSSGLPVVTADRVQVQQVILNLITNAVEAMKAEAGGPRELTVNSGWDDETELFIEVRDSGAGLDPAHLDRLFESFHTTKSGGMGLGLAISRSIVKAHGGQISAAPNQPRGAVFRFTLPAPRDVPSAE
jgi:C4-dicarboxylate-specific signal transduction histidine kinase